MKRSRLKITIEIEINDENMEAAKNCLSMTPIMIRKFRKKHKMNE